MSAIQKIESYHPDVINEFVKTGSSFTIPAEVQQVIMQMSWAMEVYDKQRNITRAAKKLAERVLASQGVDMSIPTAKSRIYSALSYFDVDQIVLRTVWLKDAANKFEDLAKIAVKSGNLAVAERCLARSIENRLQAVDQDNNKSLAVTYLISSELSAEDLGFTSKNKKEIARKASEGGYINIINQLPVDDAQKKQLLADCEIIDVEEDE